MACLRLGALEGRLPVVRMPHAAESGYYGSIYPSVQNLLLAARAMGLGASLITLPLWSVASARRTLELASQRHSVLHRATRVVTWGLRADHPSTGRRGDAPRCLRQPGLARHVMARDTSAIQPPRRASDRTSGTTGDTTRLDKRREPFHPGRSRNPTGRSP